MTPEEKNIEILLFLSISKLFSDHSTFLIKEFRQEKKQAFNLAVTSVDNFIKLIEKDVDDYNKETLQILVEAMNNGISDLRKEINEVRKKD